MTKKEILNVTITLTLIALYSVVVFFISDRFDGVERWAWMLVFLIVAFVLGRLINLFAKKILGIDLQ